MYWDHMNTGWWVLMSLGGVIVWGLIVWAALTIIREARDRRPDAAATASATEVLDQRLARGEIGVEEYHRIRDTLHGSATARRDSTPKPPTPSAV